MYFVVSAPLESFDKMETFFLNKVHAKRVKDRVVLKMIINRDAERYGLVRRNMPFTKIKYLDTNTSAEYGVLNDLLFIANYKDKPYAVLIKDENLASTFKVYFEYLWRQGRTVKIPSLVKTNSSIASIIKRYAKKNPIIVSDASNFPKLSKLSFSIVKVTNNNIANVRRVNKIIQAKGHKVVIGVGGCTALDVARACATEHIPSVLIPTILSTVCISVDKSVFKEKGETKTFHTESPHEVILSRPAIMQTERTEMLRWARSGYGDLLAKVGAAIDVVYRETQKTKDVLSIEKVRRLIPEVFDAIVYVTNQFNGFNENDIETLGVYLHEASASVIVRDSFELSGGAEHNLAYIIERKYWKKGRKKPDHGIIVAIGNLLVMRLFSDVIGDDALYKTMRHAYEVLGLPTTYQDIEEIGVTKTSITKGIRDMRHFNTFLSRHASRAIELLDDVFLPSDS